MGRVLISELIIDIAVSHSAKGQKIGRPFRGALFMGEEKPDEELMGKRKSSPRLSTASCDADDSILSGFGRIIHAAFKNMADVYLRNHCVVR